MASSHPTDCPSCGGPAYWNTDDGVTYCESPDCGKMSVPYPDYRPPDRRGGGYDEEVGEPAQRGKP